MKQKNNSKNRLLKNSEEDIFFTAKKISFKYLSKQMLSEFLLCQKLQRKNFDEETIKKTIDYLKGIKLIDDIAYAKTFVSHMFLKKVIAKKNIFQKLLQKGISKSIATDVTSFITDEFEYENALKIAQKKFTQIKQKSKKEFKCQIVQLSNFLLRKGFSYDMIFKITKKINSN